jgi:hypothetical protein
VRHIYALSRCRAMSCDARLREPGKHSGDVTAGPRAVGSLFPEGSRFQVSGVRRVQGSGCRNRSFVTKAGANLGCSMRMDYLAEQLPRKPPPPPAPDDRDEDIDDKDDNDAPSTPPTEPQPVPIDDPPDAPGKQGPYVVN